MNEHNNEKRLLASRQYWDAAAAGDYYKTLNRQYADGILQRLIGIKVRSSQQASAGNYLPVGG